MNEAGPGATVEAQIYPEREDTLLLLRFARTRGTGWCVEVGCGTGAACREAARHGWRAVGTDLNPQALASLQRAAGSEGLVVRPVRTDLLRGLGRFDLLLANPPYLPTRPGERDPDRWTNLALDGGPDGLATTRRIVRALPEHLAPGGRAFVVISSLSPAERRRALAASWRRHGRVRVAAMRPLEGERLEVWEFALGPTSASRRRPGPRRGTGTRRRARRARPAASSRGTASGGSRARGGASGRRRSPPGS